MNVSAGMPQQNAIRWIRPESAEGTGNGLACTRRVGSQVNGAGQVVPGRQWGRDSFRRLRGQAHLAQINGKIEPWPCGRIWFTQAKASVPRPRLA